MRALEICGLALIALGAPVCAHAAAALGRQRPPQAETQSGQQVEVPGGQEQQEQPQQQPEQQSGEHQKPLLLKPDLPSAQSNHRLILKDGSYQLCRRYEIVNGRVRYISIERGGEMEELPADLVDWDATRKWERDHANMAEEPSPGMKEAAEVDQEEAAARAAEKARRPEIYPALELPDQDGVFALDTFRGTPELVELPPQEVNVAVRQRKGIQVINPAAGASARIELQGAHAKIHLHVNDPVFYLPLEDGSEEAASASAHAMVVDTGRAAAQKTGRQSAHSLQAGYYIVRAEQRKTVRIVAVLHKGLTGKVDENVDVIPLKAEPLEGRMWIKLTPAATLTAGDYALVEMLPDSEMSATVWDFQVDPGAAENPEAYGPVQREKN
jgi:hypothetical protein